MLEALPKLKRLAQTSKMKQSGGDILVNFVLEC